MLTVSGGRRWEAAEWSPSSPPPPPSGLPAPTDLGDTLDAYLSQPGGQTIVIPAGKHLTGSVSNRQHADWLILLAEKPGSVTADGCSILGCSRVLIGGVSFGGSVWPAQGTSRLVLWYCDVTGTPGRAGVNAVSNSGGSPPGDYVWVIGSDIHDCDHDGMKAEASNARFQGGRMWGIKDPAGANHDDCYQTRRGMGQVIADFVFGLDKADTPSPNGHTQIQSDLGQVQITMQRGWITQSGNFPVTAGDKGTGIPCDATLTDLYAWANNYETTVCNASGASVTSSNVTLAAPPEGMLAPDVAWQQAHPYETAADWLASAGI